jgi:hypothetical protein
MVPVTVPAVLQVASPASSGDWVMAMSAAQPDRVSAPPARDHGRFWMRVNATSVNASATGSASSLT